MFGLFRRKPVLHSDPSPFDLALAGMRQWVEGRDSADLARAIDLMERAADHADRPAWLLGLFLLYRDRYDLTEAEADLTRLIEVGESTVDSMPADHSFRTACMGDLASAYMWRFNRTARVADLDRSIGLLQELASDTLVGARWLGRLGATYRLRYQHTGVLSDLDLGLDLGERAVAAAAGDAVLRTELLDWLGQGYALLHVYTRNPADLGRAIEIHEEVVASAEGDQPDHLSTLAGLYARRHGHSEDEFDLARAVELDEQALAATPADHPDLAGRLSTSAIIHLTRYDRTAAPADGQRAVDRAERAVRATPDDDPKRAARLANLGLAHLGRFEDEGHRVDRDRLHGLARQVLAVTAAAPIDRIRARYEVGALAHAMGEHSLAATLLDQAVDLRSSAVPLAAGWADQERQVTRFEHLVSATVAAHCALDDPVGAINAAELGRGVMLGGQLDFRTDLTGLPAKPATRLRELHAELAPGESPVVTAPSTARRKHLWAEYDALLRDIRARPGFDGFLLPPPWQQLRPVDGAAVLVNTGRWRSDAIIVMPTGEPVLVPLPDLRHDEVYAWADALLDATRDSSSLVGVLKKRRVLSDVLGRLWDAVVEPVLVAIRSAWPTDDVLRVWWLPIGVHNLFPLHAAGHPGRPGALDTAVSSYTPTLRTLAHVRDRPRVTVRRQLTVALSRTPGATDLPGTAGEATLLHTNRSGATLLTDHDATAARVLAALPDATWAHFACHATADPVAPSRGGLHLHDGVLPLPAISRLDLRHAELAYLSACSTAGSSARHADESLHLASSFQLAGYRHVVASLWPLDDQIAAAAARSFYEALPSAVTADHAATALHRVTRDLRAAYPDRPDLWATLIHNGP